MAANQFLFLEDSGLLRTSSRMLLFRPPSEGSRELLALGFALRNVYGAALLRNVTQENQKFGVPDLLSVHYFRN